MDSLRSTSSAEAITTPVLEGVLVVVFALNLPGPAAAARLRAMGAQVVKIEPPTGDPFAAISPDWYRLLHKGVEVLRLDLKTPQGREKLEKILGGADVLITSFRKASLERLALDASSVTERHPHLCHVSISGFPGTLGHVAGHDLTYQAAAGLLQQTTMPRALIADIGGAERTVAVVMTLLFARVLGRTPWQAEVSLGDVARDFAMPVRMGGTAPDGLLGGSNPFYRMYATHDGFIALAALEPQFQRTLLTQLQIEISPPIVADGVEISSNAVMPGHAVITGNIGLTEQLQAEFMKRSALEWQEWGVAHDVPIAVLMD